MSNPSSKFFVFSTFFALALCCILSMWFFFVSTVVRSRDIKAYKVDNAMIITNIYRATQHFLNDFVTNNISSQGSDVVAAEVTVNNVPQIFFEDYGYAFVGQGVAIYPNDIYYYVGDYHPKGLITKISDRSIYCLSPSNTIAIIRRSRSRESSVNQGASPSTEDVED